MSTKRASQESCVCKKKKNMPAPLRIKLKGFGKGQLMSLKEYAYRIADVGEKLEYKVKNLTKEQQQRFRLGVMQKVPYVQDGTYSFEFEIKLFSLLVHFSKLFNDELYCPPPPMPQKEEMKKATYVIKRSNPAVIIKHLQVKGLEFEDKFPGGMEHLKKLKEMTEENHHQDDEKEENIMLKSAYADGVLLHLSLYGITPF